MSLGPIPIKISPFFWALAIAIGWLSSMTALGTLLWVLIIFFSVLIHELGHALTAMTFGQQVEIEFVAMGGLTKRWGRSLNLLQEFIVVFNGPLAGLALCGVAYYLQDRFFTGHTTTAYILQVTAMVNLFWTLVNLLPVQPLDGGKLLSIILEALFGFTGVKIALFLSMALAGTIAFLFFALQDFLPGALFLIFAFESFRLWRDTQKLSVTDRDPHLHQELKIAEQKIQSGQVEEAETLLRELRRLAVQGTIFITATEMLANLLAVKHQYREAYSLLLPLERQLSLQGLRLLHRLAYHEEDWQRTVKVGAASYQLHPAYDTAILNALAHARLGEKQPAVGWLHCAQKDGAPNFDRILAQSEFDSIRPLFQENRDA